MSGHSKWSTIKHKKAAMDAKRSQLFSKMAGLIAICARDGADPNFNPKLKMAIDRAKQINMPIANIERAIKRGSGPGEDSNLEELLIEAYGPRGKAILIKAITDNKNRTIAEIKNILNKNGGKMAEGGAVKWLFEEKGEIILKESKLSDEDELSIIDAGSEDIKVGGGEIIVITNPMDLDKVKNNIVEKGIEVDDFSLSFIPKNMEEISEEERAKYEKLLSILDGHQDVNDLYYNFEI